MDPEVSPDSINLIEIIKCWFPQQIESTTAKNTMHAMNGKRGPTDYGSRTNQEVGGSITAVLSYQYWAHDTHWKK